METELSSLAPGVVVAGKLRVVRPLGMGGMGAVYEVEHELTKHRRALKLLHPQYKAYPHIVERFLREASAAGRIGNPHIIETFDAGELESGDPYLVMELLEGQTLADRLEAKGELSLGEAAELVRQACTGVQAAHDAGIVHRDLKPDNLFVIEKDGRPFVKILDFGVSKFDPGLTGGLGMTQEGATLGTPFYMPPEQIRGDKQIDARADIYALGVILYECVSGCRPFSADTLAHLAVLIHEGKPVPLGERKPELASRFSALVHQAMAKDREDRPKTARELADALATFTPQVLGPTVGWPGRGNAPAGSPGDGLAGQKHAASASFGSGVALPEAATSGRAVLPFVLVAGAVVLVALVILWLGRRDGAGPARSPVLAAAPVASSFLPATAASRDVNDAPSPSASTPAEEARVRPPAGPDPRGAVARPAQAGSLTGRTDPPPSRAEDPKGKSRVDERGLAKDNPFK